MKQFNYYIQEKLKITSKTKINSTKSELLNVPNIVNNYTADKILYVWGFEKGAMGSKKVGEVIKKWVLDNNVEDVIPAADPETLEENRYIIPKEILEIYDNRLTFNEECQYRLGSAKEIYSFDTYTQIYAAPDVIALVGSTGTLYCLPDHTV